MNQSDTTVQIAQTVQDLFRHYCAELPDDVVMKVCRNAMINLTHWEEDSTVSVEENDEVAICLNIIRQLKVLNKPEAINTFSELHRRFKRGNLVANRSSILLFLLRVSEGRYSSLSHNFTKLRIISRKTKTPNKSITNGDGFEGNRITVKRETSPSIINSTAIPRPSTLSHNNNTTYKRGTSHDSGKDIFSSTAHSPVNTKTFAPKSNMTTIGTINYKCGRVFAPESAVLSDLIYSFQGIPGDIIRLDPDGNFIIDPQVEVKQRTIVEGLLEVGYLHNRVLLMNKVLSKLGSVALGVQAAVTYKMRDYYGFIGELSSKVARQCSGEDTPLRDDGPPDVMITFRALRMLLIPPTAFLQTLCDALLTIGTSHRGGAIISVLHTLSQHGDLRVSDSINFLLSYAGKPLMKMIQSWIVHGELIDPYDEFFVAINQDPKNKNIWHNKFHIRYHLIPNVITESKAEIILKCGKAIHFLNNICNCKVPITGSRLVLHQLKDAAVVSLFDDGSELSRLLVSIYEETSALILESLTNEFKLYQHFLALRKYILLSQGDFATSLIQLLEPEMRKSAKKLQTYKLNGQLSAAIRASSASFEDPDIINRLEVKQLECSDEDTGYDVFSLCYIMNEPIDTAFRISDGAYCHIFNFLWRTKGMNHILMNLVNSRRALKDKISRLSQIIPETKEVLIRADRLSMELVHFAKEFEYYLQFEVIECVWEKFSETFQKAKSLDDVIIAHNHFVATIEKQTFLDPSSRNFITDLRTIWDVVYTLEDLEEKFRSKVLEKLNEKEEEEAMKLEEGYDFADLSDIRIKDKEFIKYLHYVKAHYDIFIRNYQNALKKFLLDLSTRKDYQLRMLSARLDYNEYYKRSDSRITDSMKFSRCSDVFTDLIA